MTDDLTEIIVEKTAAPGSDYDSFVACLPDDDSRYAVLDFQYTEEGGKREKVLFVLW